VKKAITKRAMTIIMMIVAMTMSKRVTLVVVVGKAASLKGSSDDIIETCMAFFMTA
jgi:hypothetical protein